MKILLILALLAVLQAVAVERPSSERRLTKMLIKSYSRVGVEGRPVQDPSDIWNITMGLALTHYNLHYPGQAFDAVHWLTLGWNDPLLTWDKAHYDGITNVRLRPSDIALPDITPFNAIARDQQVSDVLVVVYNNGAVLWVNPVKQRFSCLVPPPGGNNEFNCTMKYGSWTYDGNHVDVIPTSEHVDISHLHPSPDWEVTGTSAKRTARYYPCCAEPYVDVSHTITFRRKSD